MFRRKSTVVGRQELDMQLGGNLGLNSYNTGSQFFPLTGAAALLAEVN